MNTKTLTQEINQLPPEEQREVVDFVAFLRSRHKPGKAGRGEAKKPSKAPFIGIWKDRKDMKDSVKWVRKVRKTEWA